MSRPVSVQKFATPVEEATTSSLEALKAYSVGLKTRREKGELEAIPFYKRAIELDPNFALAYASLGVYTPTSARQALLVPTSERLTNYAIG